MENSPVLNSNNSKNRTSLVNNSLNIGQEFALRTSHNNSDETKEFYKKTFEYDQEIFHNYKVSKKHAEEISKELVIYIISPIIC